MNETSLSLLFQLRSSPKPENWNRLVELYAPLVRSWLRRYEVQACDTEDLVQEVLMAVARDLPKFDHGGHPGAFRGWLKAILVNRLRNFWRTRAHGPQARGDSDIERQLEHLSDPASELSQTWNRQHDQHVLRQLLALAEPHFAPSTWNAFSRVALDGEQADVVAKELEISLNAVFIAKSRVLSRLRQLADGLVESSSDFFSKC
jgi:RNA polymerase sigma-70 factor (ECF subfamily)